MPPSPLKARVSDMYVEKIAHYHTAPAPGITRYSGTMTIGANVEPDADIDDALARRARQIVARDLCMEPGCIVITKLEVV